MPGTVVFIHGFMGSALNWGPVRTEIEAAGWITAAFDLLGHAKNHPTKPFPNAHKAMVDDLETKISVLETPVILVAHSFGLRPALLLGNRYPEKLYRLIVEDSSPVLSAPGYAMLKQILNETPDFITRDEARAYFSRRYPDNESMARFLFSNISADENDQKYSWRFDKPFLLKALNEARDHPLWEAWANFTGAIDLIYGGKSPLFSHVDVRTKMANIRSPRPYSQICIPSAGHWIHSEERQEFVNALLELLSR